MLSVVEELKVFVAFLFKRIDEGADRAIARTRESILYPMHVNLGLDFDLP